MSNLTKRVLSATMALLLLFLSYLFGKEQGVIWVAKIILLIGSYEYWVMLIKPIDRNPILFVLYLMSCAFCLLVSLTVFNLLAMLCLVISIMVLALWIIKKPNESLLDLNAKLFLGVFYTSLFSKLALEIFTLPQGIFYFLGLLLIVFSNDIFAYFVGLNFGKTPLLPALSPKKTWEGAWGGMLGAAVTAFVYFKWVFVQDIPVSYWVMFSVCVCFAAISGDLFESLIKRVAQVKDSGKIMPGHGGVLDRIDGVLFAAPFYYVFVNLFL